mgnify:CR=1 FL=1
MRKNVKRIIEFSDDKGKFVYKESNKPVKLTNNPRTVGPVRLKRGANPRDVQNEVGKILRNPKIKGSTRRHFIKINNTIIKQTNKPK